MRVALRNERINDELIKTFGALRTVVKGAGNGDESITANVTDIPFTEVEDEFGLWDGTSFTVPSDGDYIVTGGVTANTGTSSWSISTYVNGGDPKTAGRTSNSSINTFSAVRSLVAGQVLTVRSNSAITLVDSPANHHHHIHIQKILSN